MTRKIPSNKILNTVKLTVEEAEKKLALNPLKDIDNTFIDSLKEASKKILKSDKFQKK